MMTHRERFRNTALCKPVDRLPFFMAFGPWGETVARWRTEGLTGKYWNSEFDFDPGLRMFPVNLGYLPKFERKVIERLPESYIQIDDRGILMECRNDGNSIPKFIEYPVKTYEDWIKLRDERLDPDAEGRLPGDFDHVAEVCNEADIPVQLGFFPYGLFGTLRDMMGVEELLVSFYDRPEMIREMMDHLTDFWIAIYEKICARVKVDCVHMWEDMSGKQGSLISPAMVREFMLPNYAKIKAFCDRHDIPAFSVDTDGNCDELIPLFMEAGVNMMYPFEVAAGSDVVAYREKYPDLCIMGGIDKRAIADGPEALDAELARIAPVFDKPGYIASPDHLIHPQVSYDNMKYFISKLKEYIFKS